MRDYNGVLLEAVKQKLSEAISPVEFLTNTLCIGKEAAYRRLRGEVSLTLSEAVLIAKELRISLDALVGLEDEKKLTFFMQFPEFNNPTQADYKALQEHIDEIQLADKHPDSQLDIATNTIPQQLYLQYENLTRFFLFMRAYNQKAGAVKPYHQIVITERMKEIFKDSFNAHARFQSIRLVLDKYILQYQIESIRYFFGIGLITREEVELISEDLSQLLNYLEKIAITGKNENKSRVALYISNINFDKNCTTIKIGDRYTSIVETYILNGVGTNDKSNYDKMVEWIASRCRLSTMISACGDLQRIAFFDKQRHLLSTLLNDNDKADI